MFCASCGNQAPDRAAFCPQCGSHIDRGPAASQSPAPDPSGAAQPTGWWDAGAAPSNAIPPPAQSPGSAHGEPFNSGATPDWAEKTPPQALSVPVVHPTRSPARLLVAGVGVVAVIIIFSLVAHGWSGHNGGGSSPADATNRLANAARHEDPVGIMSMVAPGELSAVTREVKGATNRAASFKLLNSSSNPLGFLSVSVDNLKTKVVTLAPGFAKVEFEGGTIGYKLNPSEIPKSWNVDTSTVDSSNNQGSYDIAQASCNNQDQEDNFDGPPAWCHDGNQVPFAIIVKENGRWYFSIAYTAMEYWRVDQGLQEADIGSALNAPNRGGSSPEDAVTKTLKAVGSIQNEADLDQILALLPPDELGAFYDYRAAIHQALENGNVTFPGELYQVVGTPTYTTGPGNHDVRVYPKEVDLHYTSTDDYSGDTTEGDARITQHCVQDSGSNDNEPQCLTANKFARDLGVTDIFVSTVEEHGRWYVSPVDTLGDYINILVAHINHNTIKTLRDDLNNFDSGSDGFATDAIQPS